MLRFASSLYARLAFCLTLVFLAVGLIGAKLLYASSNAHRQLVTQHMHADLAKYVTKDHLLFNEKGLDLKAAKMTFMQLMVLGPDFEFYILDTQGQIMAYSAKPGVVKREYVALGPIQELLATQDIDSPILGDNPRNLNQQKIFSAAPIASGGNTIGYLYVILGSDIFDAFSESFADSKMWRTGLWLVFASLAFGLIASLLLIAMMTRPLTRLTSEIKNITEAGFSRQAGGVGAKLSHWDEGSADEIHTLGSSFNVLLNELEKQYQQVINVDELRKELLTHISHDLRTPLASLLGYLETWSLNKGKVPKEQSDEYIAIARRNAQKIARLIEQLFELAHLDSGNVQVNKEAFSIAELATDVMQKFAVEAERCDVTLGVEPQSSTVLVQGDIEKLERALSNLVENALRHTPKGGRVVVKLNAAGHFAAIEVSDTGIGIPEEDLPHIFDAHFKAGNSVRGNSAHGGIGLAITKKIIALHDSEISVISRVDHGTTFSFQLPCAAA